MHKFLSIIIITLVAVISFSFYPQDSLVDESLYIIHQVDTSKGNLKLFWKDENGKIYGSLKNLKNSLEATDQSLVFAMNGGMYNKDGRPQGLFIQEGKEVQKIDTIESAYGNFYLQPNGIFYLTTKGKPNVIQTSDFKMDSNIKYATQSGPMLLINGEYHEKLLKGSTNLHIRNAVGILPNGEALFVMSKERVNFYDLATLFKQRGCSNALYLDGFVSRAYLPSENWIQLDGSFGVIIGEIQE